MATASTPRFGIALARDLGVRMRDGARLAADVWRPATDDGEPLAGPFPTVIVRTPYGRTGERYQRDGEFWARHGYVYVVQDVRGRFDSEGEFVLLADEGPDGYDTIEWAAALPYSDGRVGTYGTSYSGWVQNAAALERPPHLRAMWITQGGSNGLTNALRHNGALELRWLTWAVSHGVTSPEARRDPALQRRLGRNTEGMLDWLRRLPWGRGPDDDPLHGLEGYAKWARDLYEQADDGDFWRQRGLNFEPYVDESADVPTVYCGGWYDSYTRATTDNFVTFGTRFAHQHLLMGPWTHGDAALDRAWAGEVDLGPDAPMAGGEVGGDRQHALLRWFDRWLRDIEDTEERPPGRLFVMGGGSGHVSPAGRLIHGGRWRDASQWPPEGARPFPLYLQTGGRLGDVPPEDGGASTYRFDPAAPLPTVSANTSSLNELAPAPRGVTLPSPITLVRVMVIQGGADQRTREETPGAQPPYGPLEDRDDVLLFETEPLTEPLEAIGPVEATVYFQSDAPDTDLFVMVQDAYPPSEDWPEGYRLNVADGILRLRYREGMDRPRPLTPGEVVEARFALYPTSNRFARGHRIRVLVSSSSFPRFDVNPNTGEPIGRHTALRVASNTVHHSARYPSRVTLTAVPAP